LPWSRHSRATLIAAQLPRLAYCPRSKRERTLEVRLRFRCIRLATSNDFAATRLTSASHHHSQLLLSQPLLRRCNAKCHQLVKLRIAFAKLLGGYLMIFVA
jgi:hypothetical protein